MRRPQTDKKRYLYILVAVILVGILISILVPKLTAVNSSTQNAANIHTSFHAGDPPDSNASTMTKRARDTRPSYPSGWNSSKYLNWYNKFQKPSISDAQLDHYLDQVHRSPSALVFALTINWRQDLLSELKQHRNDPVACAFLATKLLDPTDKLIWAERLSKADPENPLGKLLEAAALNSQGKMDEALTVFRTASDTQNMDTYGKDVLIHYKSIEGLVGKDIADLQYLKTGQAMACQIVPVIFEGMNGAEGGAIFGPADYKQFLDKISSQEWGAEKDSLTQPLMLASYDYYKALDPAAKQTPEAQAILSFVKRSSTITNSIILRQHALMILNGDAEGTRAFASGVRDRGWPSDQELQSMIDQADK